MRRIMGTIIALFSNALVSLGSAGLNAAFGKKTGVTMAKEVKRRDDGTFLPGHSPGRPPGVRPKTWLQKRFIEDLANECERSGPDALKIAAKEEPIRFLELAAKLLPKEILVGNAINELDDEAIELMIAEYTHKLEQQTPALLIDATPEKSRVG